MPRNGSGNYSRVSGTPYVYNTLIDQIIVNNEMDDIGTALTMSLAKDGQTTMIANLPMGGYKLTGLSAGTGDGESIRHEQVATSAALRALVFDETGGGSLVFAESPTLVTPILGTPTSGNISNCTGSPTLTAPALGTPTALVGTNITGTAAGLSIGGNAATATTATGSAVVTGTIGYATGAGGAVTQVTSLSTPVTLNKICGQITTVSPPPLSALTPVHFTVNNSLVDENDVVEVNYSRLAGDVYGCFLVKASVLSAGGGFVVTIVYIATSGSADPGAAFKINFAVIKSIAA